VLLLAHGTPGNVDEIPEYLRNVVSGRPMPQHVVEEIQHRYSLIGEPKGHSPLTDLTLDQARLVHAELASQGKDLPVYVGMRNWRPYIADVVKQMRGDGIEEAAVICMAPQNSRTSTGLYRRAVQAEAGDLKFDFTESWAQDPLLIEAFSERLKLAWERLSAEVERPVPVIFTAHSVPCRTIMVPAASEGEPRLWPAAPSAQPSGAQPADPGLQIDLYAQQAKRTAALVAEKMPELPAWYFAFQSQGASGGPWIGPGVEATLDSLAAEGVKTVVLQPIGFLCDHVEILYDIDIAFKEHAESLGIRLERPDSLNDSPLLARAVAKLALEGLARLQN